MLFGLMCASVLVGSWRTSQCVIPPCTLYRYQRAPGSVHATTRTLAPPLTDSYHHSHTHTTTHTLAPPLTHSHHYSLTPPSTLTPPPNTPPLAGSDRVEISSADVEMGSRASALATFAADWATADPLLSLCCCCWCCAIRLWSTLLRKKLSSLPTLSSRYDISTLTRHTRVKAPRRCISPTRQANGYYLIVVVIQVRGFAIPTSLCPGPTCCRYSVLFGWRT